MRILTFDTSLDKMYITLSLEGKVIDSRIVENSKEKYHSAYLIPSIVEILKQKSLTMQDISAIGVNIGPGSFTGIRAGVTVARVIGQSLNIPVAGVPSLEIISRINDTQKPSLCMMDARKNMVYTAKYDNMGNVLLKPQSLGLEDAIDIAKNDEYFIITDNKMHQLLAGLGIESINYQQENYDFGQNLAELTYKRLKQANDGEYNWYNCKPLYIQPPPITMPKAVKV